MMVHFLQGHLLRFRMLPRLGLVWHYVSPSTISAPPLFSRSLPIERSLTFPLLPRQLPFAHSLPSIFPRLSLSDNPAFLALSHSMSETIHFSYRHEYLRSDLEEFAPSILRQWSPLMARRCMRLKLYTPRAVLSAWNPNILAWIHRRRIIVRDRVPYSANWGG